MVKFTNICPMFGLIYHLVSFVKGCGANLVGIGFRPNTEFLSLFPQTPSVTVASRGSVQEALKKCNRVVGLTKEIHQTLLSSWIDPYQDFSNGRCRDYVKLQ